MSSILSVLAVFEVFIGDDISYTVENVVDFEKQDDWWSDHWLSDFGEETSKKQQPSILSSEAQRCV